MYDLKKLEENFHRFLKTGFNEEKYNIDEIRLTEDLLEEMQAIYIPFGFLSYFLVIEEEPVLYVRIATRMDVDTIVFICEDTYESYDVFFGKNEEISEKYASHSRNVKRFKDMKMIF